MALMASITSRNILFIFLEMFEISSINNVFELRMDIKLFARQIYLLDYIEWPKLNSFDSKLFA